MKKLIIYFLLSCIYLLSITPVFSAGINPIDNNTQALDNLLNESLTGERVDNFDSIITIKKDGSIDIKETIRYFFSFPRHGIYRYIPYTLEDQGKRYDMKYQFSDIIDENGKKYNSKISTSNGQYFIKIGDANKTISGFHTYIISYSVKGALRYFDNHDELYWNITGNKWTVPIKKATTTIFLPDEIKKDDINTVCFTGTYGSNSKNCTGQKGDGFIRIETTKFLDSNEGLTVATGFPKGIVAIQKPELYVPFFERWYGKITLIGIVITGIFWYLILPIYLVVKWFRYGRDPYVGIATTATFDPPKVANHKLTPGQTGALLDETVDKRDLFAIIVDLARRGYLKIDEPKEKEFHLIKTLPQKKDVLSEFEKILYDGIFTTGENVELKKVKFYTVATKAEDQIYNTLVELKLFPKNPKKTRNTYYAIGAIAIITLNFILSFVAFVFGRVMPRKTLLGARAAQQAQGLKNFLKSQERQLNFQGDKQMLFEKLLPYAIAFGVEKQWAKRFEKFDLRNPEWYQGTSSTHFNAALFAASMSHSYSNFASSATPPSSSSSSGFGGGGFSGGGGGGGGGGSW